MWSTVKANCSFDRLERRRLESQGFRFAVAWNGQPTICDRKQNHRRVQSSSPATDIILTAFYRFHESTCLLQKIWTRFGLFLGMGFGVLQGFLRLQLHGLNLVEGVILLPLTRHMAAAADCAEQGGS